MNQQRLGRTRGALLRIVIAVAAVGALSSAATVAFAASSASVIKVPFVVSSSAQADIAACVGEQVTVTNGLFNVVTQITPTRFVFHRNVIDATATGALTGTQYRASGHLQLISATPPSGVVAFSFELTLTFVSVGPAGRSFSAHAVEHITITPDGVLTSWVEISEIRCA